MLIDEVFSETIWCRIVSSYKPNDYWLGPGRHKCTEGALQSLDVGATELDLNPRSITNELGMSSIALNLRPGSSSIKWS